MSDVTQAHAHAISLAEALAIIDRVEPVAPVEHELRAARGYTLAVDARTDGALRLAGARLRRIDIALLASHGIDRIAIRVPHVLVMHAAAGAEDTDPTAALIARAIDEEGGVAPVLRSSESATLEAACNTAEAAKIHAIVVIGAGAARDAAAVRTLARIGRLDFDGVAVNPGGAIAFGNGNGIPVLLLPGRLDAALAGWLALGRRFVARLAFRLIEEQPYLLELARPVASTPGTAEIVPVRRRAAQVEPMPGDAWSPQSLARTDGWILVSAESGGLPAGSRVQMRPWP